MAQYVELGDLACLLTKSGLQYKALLKHVNLGRTLEQPPAPQ